MRDLENACIQIGDMVAADAPSLLLVMGDAWRSSAFSKAFPGARDPLAQTPSIDAFAASSSVIAFERAYTSFPLCAPSRASLFSGRHVERHRVVDNARPLSPSIPTLSAALQQRGWATAYVGKWHLAGEKCPRPAWKPLEPPPFPLRHGFIRWAQDACEAVNQSVASQSRIMLGNGSVMLGNHSLWEPGAFTDFALQILRRFVEGEDRRPFFLAVSWRPPHPPTRSPPIHQDAVDAAVRQASWLLRWKSRLGLVRPGDRTAFWRSVIRPNVEKMEVDVSPTPKRLSYWAACRALDAEFDRLLRALDASATTRQRIVVLTSDHGEMLGSHGLTGKEVWWEEAVRIPLLIRVPQTAAAPPRVWLSPVSTVDIAPTLLGLCGVEAESALRCTECNGVPTADGRDLSAMLHTCTSGGSCQEDSVVGGGPTWRLLGMLSAGWMAAATARIKVVAHYATQDLRVRSAECFDLEADPFEQRPIALDLHRNESTGIAMSSRAEQDCVRVAHLLTREVRRTRSAGTGSERMRLSNFTVPGK